MPPCISVIIPVYNAEKYLSVCLESVCGQTLSDIEIICVDDGSADSSPEILAKYACRDARIRVITQPNAGAGAARNTGLQNAVGDYLAFIDADDFWKPQLLQRAYTQIKDCDADICLYPNAVYDDRTGEMAGTQYAGWFPARQPFHPSEYPDRLFQMTVPAPGYRLYRRDFILEKDLKFLPQHIAEDIYFVFLSLAFAEKICCIRDVYACLRRGIETNLSSALWKYPRETHDSLMKIRQQLENEGLYQTYRQTFRTAAIASSEYIFWHVSEDILPADERIRMLSELDIADKPSITAYHGDEKGENRLQGKLQTIRKMIRVYGADYAFRFLLQKIRRN